MTEKKERVEETKEERKQSLRNEIIKGYYDKPKKVEFKKIDSADMIKHFRFPILIQRFNVPLTAKAVYPVLCSRANFTDPDKWTQISQKNIAKLSGLSHKAVVKGINILRKTNMNGSSYLTADLVQQNKRRFYRYKANFSRITDKDAEKYKYFVFYTAIIVSGIWASMSLRAKALYIAMREDAFYDKALYREIRDVEAETEEPAETKTETEKPAETIKTICPIGKEFGTDFDQYNECDTCKIWDDCKVEYEGNVRGYSTERVENDVSKWLVSVTPMAELCRNAKIAYSNIGKVIKELEDLGLVEKYGKIRVVYLHSQNYTKAENDAE